MFDSEVLPIIGLIAIATFGFLNGWLARRLFARSDDLSIDDLAEFPESAAPPTARWANGPRAVLLDARDTSELETSHLPGVTAVASFARGGDTQPYAEGAGDEAAASPASSELTERAADPNSARRLAEREEEIAELRTRVELLEPLLDRLRERDEWLTDLRTRHADALTEKGVELDRCEARIADLETMFSDLDDLATTFDEVGALRRQVAERESRKAASRRARERAYDEAPSMSAISGLA